MALLVAPSQHQNARLLPPTRMRCAAMQALGVLEGFQVVQEHSLSTTDPAEDVDGGSEG